MSKRKPDALDTAEKQLKECKDRLENPATHAVAPTTPTQVIDPATIILLVTTVLELIKRIRNR